MRVSDLMTRDVAECAPQESILAIALRMVDHHCGCLPVTVDDGGDRRLVGIITDRDLVCRVMAQGLDPAQTEVGNCMSFPVHTIAADADLATCAARFTAIGVRRLVVVDAENRCQGLISRSDLRGHQAQVPPAAAPDAAPPLASAAAAGGSPSSRASTFDISPTLDPDRGNPELSL